MAPSICRLRDSTFEVASRSSARSRSSCPAYLCRYRPDELFAPYDLPGTRLFHDFCKETIERSLFYGEDFTVDRSLGLNGICDFLIARSPAQLIIKAPVIAIVEAKRGVLRDGWGQCIAELVAAQKFNLQRHQEIPYTYGIVTSGLLWQFIGLSGSTVSLEPAEIPLQPLDRLLGILAWLAQN